MTRSNATTARLDALEASLSAITEGLAASNATLQALLGQFSTPSALAEKVVSAPTAAPVAPTSPKLVEFVKRNGEVLMVTPARAASWDASRKRIDALRASKKASKAGAGASTTGTKKARAACGHKNCPAKCRWTR